MSLLQLKLFSQELEAFKNKLNDLLLSNIENDDNSFDKYLDAKEKKLSKVLNECKKDTKKVQECILNTKKLINEADGVISVIKESMTLNIPEIIITSSDQTDGDSSTNDKSKSILSNSDSVDINYQSLLNKSLPTL